MVQGKDDRGNIYKVSKGDLKLTSNGKTIKIDLILNLIHGSLGENGQLAALCEILDIPLSSCDSYSAALTFNKEIVFRFSENGKFQQQNILQSIKMMILM